MGHLTESTNPDGRLTAQLLAFGDDGQRTTVRHSGAVAKAELEQALTAAVVAARTAWPAVLLPPARFLAWIAARLPASVPGSDLAAAIRKLHAGDLYLCCACAEPLALALTLFEQRLLPQVAAALRRRHNPVMVDEALQLLRTRLFVGEQKGDSGKIQEYAGRGPLLTWLRVAAVRIALNLQRAEPRHFPLTDAPLTGLLPAGSDPALDYIKERYRAVCQSALAESLRALGGAERTLLRLHFVEGLTIDALGTLLQIHRSTAARRLAAARQQLIESTRQRLVAKLQIAPDEFASLMGLVQSRLQLSLTALLRSG